MTMRFFFTNIRCYNIDYSIMLTLVDIKHVKESHAFMSELSKTVKIYMLNLHHAHNIIYLGQNWYVMK